MGLTFIKHDVNIDFIGMRKIAFILSAIILFAGIASLIIKGGPRYGIDFAGGTEIQVRFEQSVTAEEIKASLAELNLPGVSVQHFGKAEDGEYLVRVSSMDETPKNFHAQIEKAFENGLGDKKPSIQRLDMVGPKVGDDLSSNALEALYFAVLIIAVYISGRFEHRWMAAAMMSAVLAGATYLLGLLGMGTGWLVIAALSVMLVVCWKIKLNFALAATLALIHDVIITAGVFSLCNKEIDLTIVAAFLTIIGYSLNDTIIIFDRIRENYYAHKGEPVGKIINYAVNQTLSRTILTSGTTMLVVLSLYFVGGGVIHDFAFAMLIGVAVGTYSSIFISSPALLYLGLSIVEQSPKEKVKVDMEHGMV